MQIPPYHKMSIIFPAVHGQSDHCCDKVLYSRDALTVVSIHPALRPPTLTSHHMTDVHWLLCVWVCESLTGGGLNLQIGDSLQQC